MFSIYEPGAFFQAGSRHAGLHDRIRSSFCCMDAADTLFGFFAVAVRPPPRKGVSLQSAEFDQGFGITSRRSLVREGVLFSPANALPRVSVHVSQQCVRAFMKIKTRRC